MLTEALVLFACVNNTGCPETSGLYFQQNQDVKQVIDLKTEEIRQYVGPLVVDTVGPLFVMTNGGTGVIKLTGVTALQVSKTSVHLTLRWGF